MCIFLFSHETGAPSTRKWAPCAGAATRGGAGLAPAGPGAALSGTLGSSQSAEPSSPRLLHERAAPELKPGKMTATRLWADAGEGRWLGGLAHGAAEGGWTSGGTPCAPHRGAAEPAGAPPALRSDGTGEPAGAPPALRALTAPPRTAARAPRRRCRCAAAALPPLRGGAARALPALSACSPSGALSMAGAALGPPGPPVKVLAAQLRRAERGAGGTWELRRAEAGRAPLALRAVWMQGTVLEVQRGTEGGTARLQDGSGAFTVLGVEQVPQGRPCLSAGTAGRGTPALTWFGSSPPPGQAQRPFLAPCRRLWTRREISSPIFLFTFLLYFPSLPFIRTASSNGEVLLCTIAEIVVEKRPIA